MNAPGIDVKQRRGSVRAWLAAGMRYVLLRPRLKAGILRLLSINPGMLMTIKRFGVRIGLAHVMGHGHLAISGRRSDLAGQGRLSARGANIYDELRKAMIAKEG